MTIRLKTFLTAALVCCYFASSAGAHAASDPPGLRPFTGFKDDSCRVPELVSLRIEPTGDPIGAAGSNWWYLAVNFNSVAGGESGQDIRSCLRLGKPGKTDNTGTSAPVRHAVAGTCRTIGDVQVRGGVARFNGGYIECDGINIGASGSEIGIDVRGTLKEARSFWAAVKGTLSPSVSNPVPLLRYEPAQSGAEARGSIAINLTPATPAQPEGFAATSAPDQNLIGPGLTIAVKPADRFTGLFEAQADAPGQFNLHYRWRLGKRLVEETMVTVSSTPIVIDQSMLYIGGLPTGERFYGTLDLIVLDPKGGDRS